MCWYISRKSNMKRWIDIVLLVLLTCSAPAAFASSKPPGKTAQFFCRIGRWVDNFNLRGLDTTYICLPEHSWRVALNNGEVGINATYTAWLDPATPINLRMQSTPSLGLGFNVGYRSLGGGYSWDVLNSYTTNWNISMGSKMIGLEFMRNVSTNLTGSFHILDVLDPHLPKLTKGDLRIANTSLTAWYALNSTHYSHNAAIKQSYIQKRTAGSLLLSLAYMSTNMSIIDSSKYVHDEDYRILFDGVKAMVTRQVAVGIGYGINYTPNQGKVLLHAAANMQVVCYSINHVSYTPPDEVSLPGEPQYLMHPASPVHVTGNMRAAVSWEINQWVHLAAWAQANHLSFASKSGDLSTLSINNWHWQARLSVGVRFGAGSKRMRQILGDLDDSGPSVATGKNSRLPQWITDYFFSPVQ